MLKKTSNIIEFFCSFAVLPLPVPRDSPGPLPALLLRLLPPPLLPELRPQRLPLRQAALPSVPPGGYAEVEGWSDLLILNFRSYDQNCLIEIRSEVQILWSKIQMCVRDRQDGPQK